MERPDRCAHVRWHETWLDPADDPLIQYGDVVWQPKGGTGHVITASEKWGGDVIPRCECGDLDVHDHHAFVIERWPLEAAREDGQ
jgi:hypothetical protein